MYSQVEFVDKDELKLSYKRPSPWKHFIFLVGKGGVTIMVHRENCLQTNYHVSENIVAFSVWFKMWPRCELCYRFWNVNYFLMIRGYIFVCACKNEHKLIIMTCLTLFDSSTVLYWCVISWWCLVIHQVNRYYSYNSESHFICFFSWPDVV